MKLENDVELKDWKYPKNIEFVIDAAHAAAKSLDMETAIRWFDLCRTMLKTSAPPAPLKRRLNANYNSIAAEAERTRDAFLKKASERAKTRVVIIGDSLALPRPAEKENFPNSLDSTYPGVILSRLQSIDSLEGVHLWTHCQRYLTTQLAAELLEDQSHMLSNADVLIHLGLNDCAVRMFMDDQRIALGLLAQETQDKILAFSRTYRPHLIRGFPGFNYVPVHQYRKNLHRIAAKVKHAGGKSLTFTSVIVVPWKFWSATPGICHNFTNYNLTMMDTAAQVGANVLDVDRLMWQNGVEQTLLKDGMHLSKIGHQLFADNWIKMIYSA